MHEKEERELSVQGIKRLPYYLKYLKEQTDSASDYVPASDIANFLGVYEVQVRKDLAAVASQPGKPRMGFHVPTMIADIEHFLGYDSSHMAILVGAGNLGRSLMSYGGFADYGMRIVAAFDTDPELAGTTVHGCKVYAMDELRGFCRYRRIRIGIIATPADEAQKVCEALVEADVNAIWNFAHVHLQAPSHVIVQNEDMAVSYAVLSARLMQALRAKKEKNNAKRGE